MSIISITDNNDITLSELYFESLYPGRESTAQTIKIVNSHESDDIDITFTPGIGSLGSEMDTVNSTLLSLDGTDYSLGALEVTATHNATTTLYIKWHPPSNARIGGKIWLLSNDVGVYNPPEVEGFDYVSMFTVTGSSDGELTDYHIEQVIPYSGVMETDFKDVTFYDDAGLLIPYYLKSKTDGVTATYILLLDTIPEAPDSLDVYVFCGNSEATSQSDEDILLFFDDMTGTYSDKWTTIGGDYAGYNAGTLQLASTSWIRTKDFQTNGGFKAEFGLYFNDSWAYFMYCQDSTPQSQGMEKYCLQGGAPGWSDSNEYIKKDNTSISSTTPNLMGYYTWYDCIFTLDDNGNHSWKIGANDPIVATDTDYTSGYLALGHYDAGNCSFRNILVTKYTEHPPSVEAFTDWEINFNKDVTLKGKILYQPQDLPGYTPVIRYGCRVGGEYYE